MYVVFERAVCGSSYTRPIACCTRPVACCMLNAARTRRHSACHAARPIGPSARLGIPSRTISAIPRGFGIRHGAVSHSARYPLQPSVARIVLRRSTNVLQRSTTCCNNSQWLGSRPCCCPEKRKEPLQSQQRSSDGPGHAMPCRARARCCTACWNVVQRVATRDGPVPRLSAAQHVGT